MPLKNFVNFPCKSRFGNKREAFNLAFHNHEVIRVIQNVNSHIAQKKRSFVSTKKLECFDFKIFSFRYRRQFLFLVCVGLSDTFMFYILDLSIFKFCTIMLRRKLLFSLKISDYPPTYSAVEYFKAHFYTLSPFFTLNRDNTYPY